MRQIKYEKELNKKMKEYEKSETTEKKKFMNKIQQAINFLYLMKILQC